MRFYPLVALILFSTFLSAQNYQKNTQKFDFVILTDSTRITGDIKYTSGDQQVAIKPFEKPSFKLYDAASVISFRKMSTFYFTKEIDGVSYFAEPLAFGDYIFFKATDFFILEKEGQQIKVDEKNYKEVFSSAYGDRCDWDTIKAF